MSTLSLLRLGLGMRSHKFIAAVVLIEHDGFVLGVARRNDPNAFGLPGGKFNEGEDARTAAVRELREETGIEVRPDDLQLVYMGPAMSGDKSLVATFRVELPDGAKPHTPAGEGRVAWVVWDDLLSGPFGDYNRELRAVIVKGI